MKRTRVIAEIGVNHDGSTEKALELIDAAAASGADVVKFQTFRSEALVSRFAEKAAYQKRTTGSSESQLEMIRKLELSESAYPELLKRCRKHSVEFLSTPFDLGSLSTLTRKLGLRTLKISSGDITNAPLLLESARQADSVILSTGMSTLGDIELALGVLAFGFLNTGKDAPTPSVGDFETAYFSRQGREALAPRVTLLHCSSEYPAAPDEVNLKVLRTLRSAFRLPVGLSDHTRGIAVPIAAVALGARVIEKHFTLDRTLTGPDHRASLEPEEFTAMVSGIREVERALGLSSKVPQSAELENRTVARKSLVAKSALRKGELLSEDSLDVKRPGGGISPLFYWDSLGKPVAKDHAPDELIEL